MNRVAIIGSGGAGKSTLARQMSVSLELPLFHLDREFWQPGWVMTAAEARSRLEEQIVERERWIIDGNYDSAMDLRLARADTIIFLDLHPLRCLYRVVKRFLRFRGRTRPDMGPGCPERFPDAEFLAWIATFRRRQRPVILQKLDRLAGTTPVQILRSPRQVRRYLADLQLRCAIGHAALTAAHNEAARFA